MKKINRKQIRKMSFVFFIIYICVLFYFLFWSELFGRTQGYEEYRYNLQPFLEIHRFITSSGLSVGDIFINMVGNVLIFAPFGALIRWIRNKKTSCFVAVLYTFLFSLIIEVIQLVTRVGVFDVDDLILNTFGGLIGYICYLMIRKRYNKGGKKNV